MEVYLTPEDVGRELKLGVLTIYKYIREKKLRAIRFGRTYRIAKTDFDEFVNTSKTF